MRVCYICVLCFPYLEDLINGFKSLCACVTCLVLVSLDCLASSLGKPIRRSAPSGSWGRYIGTPGNPHAISETPAYQIERVKRDTRGITLVV